MKRESPIILKLGGSLVVPHISDQGGINVPFLKVFQKLILQEIKNGKRFVLMVGGGKINKVYNLAASSIMKVKAIDLDWIGIYTTRLNAYLLRSLFPREAHPRVIEEEPNFAGAALMQKSRKNIFVAGGWLPGHSTDYDTVKLAEIFGASALIKTGDVPFVYDKDPGKFSNAKAIKRISWQEYKKLIPARWQPRLSTPFDPVATRRAEKLGLTVKILDGSDIRNLQKAIDGKPFLGTLIGS